MSTFEFKKPLWGGGSLADKYGSINFSSNDSNDLNDSNDSNTTDKETENEAKDGGNAADIINASANGLGAISGLVASIMGNGEVPQQGEAPPPPPREESNNKLFIIGGFTVATLFIFFLITRNNGSTK